MRGSLHNHHRRRHVPATLVAGVLFLVLLGLWWLPMPSVLSNTAHTILAPVMKGGAALSDVFAPFRTYLFSKQQMASEIETLRTQNQSLRHDILLALYTTHENEILRDILNIQNEDNTTPPVTAAVLANPGRTLYDTLIIDAGTRRGITEGGIVRSPDGSAIGTVRHASERSALVNLFSSPESAIRVIVGTTSTNEVRALGQGSGSFLIMLPREMPVVTGDPIVLPGTPPYFIGTVEHISAGETSAFQTIRFSYPVNVFSLRYVLVGTAPPLSPLWADITSDIGSETKE